MEAEAILRELVALDTNSLESKNYAKCANLIKSIADKSGLKTKILRPPGTEKPKPNVIVDFDAGAKETLLVLTHYDVVPAGSGWRTDPFKLTEKNGKLFGRGTSDDKGAIAATLSALSKLNNSKVNIRLICSCDEETGGRDGAAFLTKTDAVRWKGKKIKYAFVPDAGLNSVGIGCSGIIRGKIIVKGKGGHAAYPFKAVNPIYKALPLLNELKKYSRIVEKKRSISNASPGNPHKKIWGRFSVTVVRAGEKTNIIPGELEIGFDLRLLPEEKLSDAKREFREFFERAKRKTKVDASLSMVGTSGYLISSDSKIVSKLKKSVSAIFGFSPTLSSNLGGNDGRYLAGVGIDAASFGPTASDANIHALNEFIRKSDLEKMEKLVIHLARSW